MEKSMRRAAVLTAITILTLLMLNAQTVSANPEYENHSLMRMEKVSAETLDSLRLRGFDIVKVTPDGTVQIVARPGERTALIRDFGAETEIENMEEFYRSRLDTSRDMGGYRTFAEVDADLQVFAQNYPDITVLDTIGYSLEGRPIFAMKISDNPEIDEEEAEAMINGLIHAREPIGMEINIYVINHLLTRYGIIDNITNLVDSCELWFVPVINPDGYVYNEITNPGGGGMWRKNRRPNANGSYGVDLNRNWGYAWGYDDFGSSPDPNSLVYRGTGPFSEPETEVMRDFINAHDFAVIVNYHSFSNYYVGPWGYISGGIPIPDWLRSDEIMSAMAAFNGYDVFSIPNGGLNGGARDWQYGEQSVRKKVYSVLPEVGDQFWPADYEINGLCLENFNSTLTAFEKALEYWDSPSRSIVTDDHFFLYPADTCFSDSSVNLKYTNFDDTRTYNFSYYSEHFAGQAGGVSVGSGSTVLAPGDYIEIPVTLDPDGLVNPTEGNEFSYHNLNLVVTQSDDPSREDTLVIPLIVVVNLTDNDSDGLTTNCDNCPSVSNSDQANGDGDSLGDLCDNCPTVDNQNQIDTDEDTFGDACDNCPEVANPGQEDGNDNGIGDACDWICGDLDNNYEVNILDIIFYIDYKYNSGPQPEFMESADVNSDLNIDILDILYLIDYKFGTGPEPNCP